MTTKFPKSAISASVGLMKIFYSDFPETFCSAFNTKIQLIDSNPYRNRGAQSKTRQKCAKVGFCNPQSHSSRVQNSQMPNHLLLEADRFQQFPPLLLPFGPPYFNNVICRKGRELISQRIRICNLSYDMSLIQKPFLCQVGLTSKISEARNLK